MKGVVHTEWLPTQAGGFSAGVTPSAWLCRSILTSMDSSENWQEVFQLGTCDNGRTSSP